MKLKRILIGIGCMALVLSLSGCAKSNINNKYTINYEEIEVSNIAQDTNLYESIKKTHEINIKNAKNNDEKAVANLKYMEDVYSLALNRFNLDIDILSVYSEEYMTYVAMMQVYCEEYVKESKDLIKNNKMYDLEYIKKYTTSGYMLSQIENSMNMFLQAMDGGE